MSDWKLLNAHRVRTGPLRSDESFGFNGQFALKINGVPVGIQASDGDGWRHVSVSLPLTPTFTPSWSIMCRVKDLFFEAEDWVVQYHPGQSSYVNNHPGCLHLWQPMNEKIPVPPRYMV